MEACSPPQGPGGSAVPFSDLLPERRPQLSRFLSPNSCGFPARSIEFGVVVFLQLFFL